jgi:outer membrane immunogenic protein
MKKLLIAGIAAAAFCGAPAIAADLPTKGPVYKAVDPIFDWSGFYVGGHAGYAWSDLRYLSNHIAGVGPCVGGGFITPCDPVNQKANGFVGGGQVGTRWQTGTWVFGIEGTWAWTDLGASSTSVTSPGTLTYDSKVKQIYTGTAQVGYASDRALWYVKGGYAGAQLFLNSITIPGGTVGPVNTNLNGWTVGTGLEYGFAPNWSLGVEYDYIQLRGNATTCSPSPGSVFTCPTPTPLKYASIRDNISEVLLRLNYRFAWGGAK